MASVSIPYNFVNGTPANAEEVDANFNSLKSFVETALVQVDGSVRAGTTAIQDAAVTADKISSAAVTKSKLNDGPSGDVPLVTVAPSAPANNTIGKNGDIWIVV